MIQISRDHVCRLHRVFKKAAKKDGRQSPTVVFQADRTGVLIHCHSSVAVEYRLFGEFPESRFGVPLSVLADFGGKDGSLVTFAPAEEDVVVTWSDAGVPQRRTYQAVKREVLPSITPHPELHSGSANALLATFAEACRTVATERSRYALDCLCLKGASGEIAATNGRQLFMVGGLTFPWTDNLLVPASELFACRELPQNRPLEFGCTDSHVVLAAGPWSIWLPIEKEARFPRMEDVIPDSNLASTQLSLSESDRQFLAKTLPKLPVQDDFNMPVTLECNGHVAIRSLSSEGHCTELVLSTSSYSGDPVKLSTNRDSLLRFVELGFTELLLQGDKRPILAQAGHCRFVWQPLIGAPIDAQADATGIVSDAQEVMRNRARSGRTVIAGETMPRERRLGKSSMSNSSKEASESTNDFINGAKEIHRMLQDACGQLSELISKSKGQDQGIAVA